MSEPDLVPAANVLYMGILMYDGEVATQNNIYFLNNEGAMSPERGKEICQGVYSWFAGSIMPYVSSEVTLFHVIGIDMTGIPHFLADSEPLPDVIGGGAAALPLVLALRVDFLTDVNSRWTRGRNFLPGIPEDKCVKSHIDATWAEAIRAAYYELVSVAYGLNCTWVIVSRRYLGAVRTEALVTPVTSVVLPDLRVRTYRQRIARFGT